MLPIAKSEEFLVEVGAIITRHNEKYLLGAPWSSGEHRRVSFLYERGPRSAGAMTATVHTHPNPGGWVGGDRALSYFQELDDRGVGGYGGEGDVQAGDLATGFQLAINIYIADDAGLHGWNFEEYRDMQHADQMKPVRLGAAYRTGL